MPLKFSHIYTEQISDDISFDMILVEGGTFMMGGDDVNTQDREKPIHKVTVPRFYIGKYLVTQEIWQAVMGDNPSFFKGAKRPVETVSWNDTKIFLKKLNELTGTDYRLPTEAEWEFAARGGIHSEGYLYAGSDKLKEVGWYVENEGNKTRAVGLKMPNELGIYDMSGNVYEWCEDDWHRSYNEAPNDGSAWLPISKKAWFQRYIERGASRVLRGGSYFLNPRFCRVYFRLGNGPDVRDSGIGFRLACSCSLAQ